MLVQKSYLKDYDWVFRIFYNVSTDDIRDIEEIMHSKSLPTCIDCGVCVTSYDKKSSYIIINKTSDQYEFYDTLIHELNHLTSHIEEYYDIDPHGEEASQLIGSVAKLVFKFLLNI